MKLFFVFCFSFFSLQLFAQNKSEDTIYRVNLPNHDVKSHRVWKNDTAQYYFNQMRYNVQVILPYLNAATSLFTEINTKLNQQQLKNGERRQFIKNKEREMKDNFEDKLKNLNETQGVLLIKLIARQTGLNVYKIIGDFRNGFAAFKYQTWARLHGFNINKKYDPTEELLLESVMRNLGYPLLNN